MPIEIIIPAWRKQRHAHKCPMCKRVKEEDNDLCRKETGAHVFVCITCAQDYRRRFGQFSDEIMDLYFTPQQREMVKHVAPDHVSDELDKRDEERKIANSRRSDGSDRESASHIVNSVPAVTSAAEQKERYEDALAQAEVINYEDVEDEIEEMKKKGEI